MTTPESRIDSTLKDFEALQLRFSYILDNGVKFMRKGAIIGRPPPGKVGVLVPIFLAGLQLSTTNLFNEIMH